MASAVSFDHSHENTAVALVAKSSVVLGLIQLVCVFVVSLINKSLEGTADHVLTGIVVAIGTTITVFYPGLKTRPRTIEGIASAAGIGLGATWVYLFIDPFVLQPMHVYTNRWHAVGGGSIWWYLPVWWMVGTYLSWLGAWILANQTNKSGAPSVPAAAGLVAVLAGICGSAAIATHFPGASWNVPTFAIAVLPALALATAVTGLGARRT